MIQYGWKDNKKDDDQEQTLPELQENDALQRALQYIKEGK